jgi:hypothetical protein
MGNKARVEIDGLAAGVRAVKMLPQLFFISMKNSSLVIGTKPIRTLTLAFVLSGLAPLAQAGLWPNDWEVCPGIDQPVDASLGGRPFEVFVSPYTHHWTPSEEHKSVRAVSVARLLPNTRFCGFSLFTNSFGQPSAYAFTGKYWPNPIESIPNLYVSLSGGVMYGYVGQFKNKVPLNVGGFSPVIIPAMGYRLNARTAVEMQILGTAAVMFGATWRY